MTWLDIWWKTPRFCILNFPFKISLFEKLYQTLVIVFHHNIKNLEVRQKYSATRRIFNSLLGVWYVMKHCVSCLIYYVRACIEDNLWLSVTFIRIKKSQKQINLIYAHKKSSKNLANEVIAQSFSTVQNGENLLKGLHSDLWTENSISFGVLSPITHLCQGMQLTLNTYFI